ncbi:MAG: hypothetical protein RSH52_17785, partial [Janthinobacterium sp.]
MSMLLLAFAATAAFRRVRLYSVPPIGHSVAIRWRWRFDAPTVPSSQQTTSHPKDTIMNIAKNMEAIFVSIIA